MQYSLGVRLPCVEDLSIPTDLWLVLFGCKITLCRRPVYPYRPVGGIVWVLGVRLPRVEDLSIPTDLWVVLFGCWV